MKPITKNNDLASFPSSLRKNLLRAMVLLVVVSSPFCSAGSADFLQEIEDQDGSLLRAAVRGSRVEGGRRTANKSRRQQQLQQQERGLEPKSAKSEKSGKGTSEDDVVCLVELVTTEFDLIGPEDEEFQGPNNVIIDAICSDERLDLLTPGMPPTGLCTTGDLVAIAAGGVALDECLTEAGGPAATEGIQYREEGWYFNRDSLGAHEFDSALSEDGDGSLRTSVNSASRLSKVLLEYIDPELQDEPASKLTGIAFDFNVISCAIQTECDACRGSSGSCNIDECLNEIYLNIFTRSSTAPVGCECNYFITLETVVSLDGPLNSDPGWQSAWINLAFQARDVALLPEASTFCTQTGCPANLQDAMDAGHVLSWKFSPSPECDYPAAFQMNVGDTECQDSGMVVHFDNLRVDYDFEDGTPSRTFNIVAE